ncbi:hypothetical protein Ancab_016477 [Ancistrocladus abbreviatus]
MTNMFLVRVNEEIMGECLYFPGEDCRLVWRTKNVDSHGPSTSSKGCVETGDFSNYVRANNQKMSENQVIGKTIGDERAWGNNMAEKCTKAASSNDDKLDKSLCMDVDGGERNREAKGLVEREAPIGVQETINVGSVLLMNKGTIDRNMLSGKFDSPKITQRELDGATSGLGHGPVCRNIEEADGLPISSGLADTRREKGGNENVGQSHHQKPRPKNTSVSSCGPACRRNSGETGKTADGLPTSSGFSEIRREGCGNENKARGSHQKSRLKKTGCIKPTMKLDMGTWQRTCEGLKKIKKKKSGCTNNKKAKSIVDSEQRMEGVTGVSISDSNIANMNRLFLQNDRKMNAEEI